MNGLRIIPGLFHSSEIQLFQMICFKIAWQQTNKDYKEELVDVLCFFNITSAVGHKVVLIPDFFTPPSMYSYFSMSYQRYLHVLQTPRMCCLSRIVSELLSAQNVKFVRFTKPKQNYVISTRKVFIRTLANFLRFQHYNRHLKTSSKQTSLTRLGR